MDSIGSIKSMENGPGGRKFDQGKRKSAPDRARPVPPSGISTAVARKHAEPDTPLGQKVDTTA